MDKAFLEWLNSWSAMQWLCRNLNGACEPNRNHPLLHQNNSGLTQSSRYSEEEWHSICDRIRNRNYLKFLEFLTYQIHCESAIWYDTAHSNHQTTRKTTVRMIGSSEYSFKSWCSIIMKSHDVQRYLLQGQYTKQYSVLCCSWLINYKIISLQ